MDKKSHLNYHFIFLAAYLKIQKDIFLVFFGWAAGLSGPVLSSL